MLYKLKDMLLPGSRWFMIIQHQSECTACLIRNQTAIFFDWHTASTYQNNSLLKRRYFSRAKFFEKFGKISRRVLKCTYSKSRLFAKNYYEYLRWRPISLHIGCKKLFQSISQLLFRREWINKSRWSESVVFMLKAEFYMLSDRFLPGSISPRIWLCRKNIYRLRAMTVFSFGSTKTQSSKDKK